MSAVQPHLPVCASCVPLITEVPFLPGTCLSAWQGGTSAQAWPAGSPRAEAVQHSLNTKESWHRKRTDTSSAAMQGAGPPPPMRTHGHCA